MKKMVMAVMALAVLLLFAGACAEGENPALAGRKTELSAPSMSIRTEAPVLEKKASVWGFSPIIGGAETLISADTADLTYAGEVEIQFVKTAFLDDLKLQLPEGERDIKDSVLILDMNDMELNLKKPELDLKKPE